MRPQAGPRPDGSPDGGFGAPAPGRLFLAHFLDSVATPSAQGSPSSAFFASLRQAPAESLEALLARQPLEVRERLASRLGEAALRELNQLFQEDDPSLLLSQALNLGRRWEREGRLEAANAMFRAVGGAGVLFGPGLEALSARAEAEWKAIAGQGAGAPRFEFLLRRFAREASDPWMIAGFGLGSLAYKTARLGVLSRLAGNGARGIFSQPFVSGLLASGAGLGVEVPAFVFTAKLGRELSGSPQDWSASALGHELAATGVTLFCLKGGGFLSARVVQGLRGPASAGVLAPELGAATRLAQAAIPQAGMFAGIVISRRLEESLGLRPRLDDATLLVDSLSTYFQFVAGGRLAERVLGPGFAARQRELDLRAASLGRGPSRFPDGTPLGATAAFAAGPGLRPRATLEEIFNAPLLSENQSGDGNGNGRRRLDGTAPHLRPVVPGERRLSEAEAQELARLHDPKVFAEQVRRKLREEKNAVAASISALRSLSAQVQTFLNHHAQGRGAAPEMAGLRQEILATYDRFLQGYREASRSHEAWIPLAAGSPALQAEVAKNRAEIHRFVELSGRIHTGAQKVLEAVAEGKPGAMHGALDLLHRRVTELAGHPPSWAPEGRFSFAEEMAFTKLAGILQGIGVKEAYRGTPEEMRTVREFQLHPWNLLDRGSGRTQDHEIPEWLFAELRHFEGRDWDPAETLIHRAYPSREEMRDPVAREVSPRELLRWGGTYQDPFRTWIGVQLPTLFAAYRGDARVFSEKIRALELFMEPETREATRVAAWWLGKALHGSGFPSEWAIEPQASAIVARVRRLARRDPPDPGIAARELGETGDLAAVGHALLAFLRHPFEPRAALELALQAPEGVREDAVSLAGALQGAFHGKEVFAPEWMAKVLLNSVPTRREPEALRQMTEFLNKEIQLQNALVDLRGLAFSGDPNGRAKVSPLRAVKPESPAWRAFRAGYEERFRNGELSAVQAIWEISVLIEQGRRDGVSPAEWKDLRRNLRTSIHRLDLSLKSLREFRASGEHAAAGEGFEARAKAFADFDLMVEKLERSLAALHRFRDRLEDSTAPRSPAKLDEARYARLREALIDAIAAWELPGLAALVQDAAPLPLDGIRALQEGAEFIGRSVRPPAHAPLFDKRGDAETVAAVLKGLAAFGPATSPGAENLMESYLLAVGAAYIRQPGRSLANQIAPSALFSVVTPAYLEANRGNPARALRELTTLDSNASPELREAWRVATYAALRLLQGAKPDLAFAQELRRSFVDSTMAQGLSALIELQLGGEAARRERLLLDWEASPDARSRVLLGLHAFLQAPSDAKSAVKTLRFSAVDPHQVAERVAGMLAELHRSRRSTDSAPPGRGQQMLDFPRVRMLTSRIVDKKEREQVDGVLTVMASSKSAYWRDRLESEVGGKLSLAARAELSRALTAMDPELIGVFGSAVGEYPWQVLARTFAEMKLIRPSPSELSALSEVSLAKPLDGQFHDAVSAQLRADYQVLFHEKMAGSSEQLGRALQSYSEGTVSLLGHWSHHPGSRLLMAQRLGLPGLPGEKALLEAYAKWDNTPPDSE
ncbi:MAG: hypothetical protein IT572_00610 [Deltaproteobacteria bacterium]|nr:hypothetical protein [Deltaproteobacteria bacterium]